MSEVVNNMGSDVERLWDVLRRKIWIGIATTARDRGEVAVCGGDGLYMRWIGLVDVGVPKAVYIDIVIERNGERCGWITCRGRDWEIGKWGDDARVRPRIVRDIDSWTGSIGRGVRTDIAVGREPVASSSRQVSKVGHSRSETTHL